MKKNIFTTLIILFTVTFCYSQDVITKKTGENIKAKILEVGLTEIKYKKFDNKNGPTYIISNSDVSMILYENGTKVMFNEEKKPVDLTFSKLTYDELFQKGQADATQYYKGYKQAGTGVLLVGLLSPSIGLIPVASGKSLPTITVALPLVGILPAIAASVTGPEKANLNYPNEALINNSAYYEGYVKKAKKIKQSKVWNNLGIAFGINLCAIAAIIVCK